jgi:hypothetical protein
LLKDRTIALKLCIVFLGFLPLLPALSAAGGECSPQEQQSTGCVSAGVGDEDVTLGVGITQPGSPEFPPSGGGDAQGGDGGGGFGPPVDLGCQFPVVGDRCQGFGPDKTVPVVPVVPPVLPVTLTDIASFRPTADVAGMEPNGWMIVGLDTNFFASSAPQVVDGVLLGQPASVRFTPVGWRWSYGDGGTATVSTAGAPWASSGVAEFSATPASHIYRAAGRYVIQLSVLYASEYRFAAGGWTPISGTLTVPTNELTATAGGATTVLVDRECTVDPRGPGC